MCLRFIVNTHDAHNTHTMSDEFIKFSTDRRRSTWFARNHHDLIFFFIHVYFVTLIASKKSYTYPGVRSETTTADGSKLFSFFFLLDRKDTQTSTSLWIGRGLYLITRCLWSSSNLEQEEKKPTADGRKSTRCKITKKNKRLEIVFVLYSSRKAFHFLLPVVRVYYNILYFSYSLVYMLGLPRRSSL